MSPTEIPTETTVPAMGLVRVAAFSDCCASVRLAMAASMAAWSDAICWGVSVPAEDPPPVPVPPDGVPDEPAPVFDVFPVGVLVTLAVSCAVWVAEDPDVPGEPVPPPPPEPVLEPEPDASAASAWPSAVSSFDTVPWSLDTACSSVETVWRADSHAVWPAGVAVLALAQSDWACVRSAASFCWSFESADWSWVSVAWSWVTTGFDPP